MSTSPPASFPTSRRTSPRSSTAAGAARRGSSTRSTQASRPSPAALDGVWGALELDLAKLLAAAPDEVRYTDVVSFPAVRQDLAFAVPEEVTSAELVDAAREAAGPELTEMRPFDLYRGEQLGEGRKSIAFAVSFQSPERTLTDEDAAALREKIVSALAKRFGAELRA
ncbi:MAG: hypothetical protein E6F97_04805 [Actinobacteria bacterium]|nr:MAG: hypothetical protein E6F97_04805 [Actinomycetota bacterium]